ncbi:hypothetical protein KKF05_03895 [Patescibacteria group bacterium]|nr:hypothetical protein [Patescibacteria group bacterium]MBU1029377.1 hypothetical protein [Patescibacteria group bacterium]
MKNKLFNLIVRATAVATVASSLAMVMPARGADLETMSDTMTRLEITTAADHDVRFVIANVLGAVGDEIAISFDTDFNTAAIVFGDVDLAYDADGTCVTFSNELTIATAAGDNAWGAAMAADVLTLTHPTNAANGDIPADRCVQVQIGTNAAGGSNQIANPGTVQTSLIEIVTVSDATGDAGSLAVSIVDDDQVTVTANVDPTLTFDIDTSTTTSANTDAEYTVDFGTLSTTGVFSGTGLVNYIMFDLSTNATSGAIVTIQNANGTSGMVSTSSSETIANANTTAQSGVENYGWCVEYEGETSGADFNAAGAYESGTCAQALSDTTEALSTSAANLFETGPTAGPVNAGRGVLSGSAVISVLTEAHDDYTDTLTFIATATF